MPSPHKKTARTKKKSSKQNRANRRNGRKSTGPRSARGKRRSAVNGYRHGLRSDRALLPGESREFFDHLTGEIFNTFAPATDAERAVVRRLAETFWMALRFLLAQFGLQCVLAEDPDRALDETLRRVRAGDVPPPPSPNSLARFRSRIVRRLDEDLARYLNLLRARAEANNSTDADSLGADTPDARSGPNPRSANPQMASVVQPASPPSRHSAPIEIPDLPPGDDLLNGFCWYMTLGLIARCPDLLPDDIPESDRVQMASVVHALRDWFPPDQLATLARLFRPAAPDVRFDPTRCVTSAGSFADPSAAASAKEETLAKEVLPIVPLAPLSDLEDSPANSPQMASVVPPVARPSTPCSSPSASSAQMASVVQPPPVGRVSDPTPQMASVEQPPSS